MQSFGQTFIVPAMREFRAAYPDIQVEVILKEERLDLVAGEADVAVGLTETVCGDVTALTIDLRRYPQARSR